MPSGITNIHCRFVRNIASVFALLLLAQCSTPSVQPRLILAQRFEGVERSIEFAVFKELFAYRSKAFQVPIRVAWVTTADPDDHAVRNFKAKILRSSDDFEVVRSVHTSPSGKYVSEAGEEFTSYLGVQQIILESNTAAHVYATDGEGYVWLDVRKRQSFWRITSPIGFVYQ